MNWPIAGIAVAALGRLAGARRDQRHRATSCLHQARRHRAENLRPERAAAAGAGRDETRPKIVGRRADDLDDVSFVNLQADQLALKSGGKRGGVQECPASARGAVITDDHRTDVGDDRRRRTRHDRTCRLRRESARHAALQHVVEPGAGRGPAQEQHRASVSCGRDQGRDDAPVQDLTSRVGRQQILSERLEISQRQRAGSVVQSSAPAALGEPS